MSRDMRAFKGMTSQAKENFRLGLRALTVRGKRRYWGLALKELHKALDFVEGKIAWADVPAVNARIEFEDELIELRRRLDALEGRRPSRRDEARPARDTQFKDAMHELQLRFDEYIWNKVCGYDVLASHALDEAKAQCKAIEVLIEEARND